MLNHPTLEKLAALNLRGMLKALEDQSQMSQAAALSFEERLGLLVDREWTEREYHNLCREDFTWNTDRRPADEEAEYTLFLYEQMRSILDAMDRHGFTRQDREGVLGANVRRALGLG